MGHLEEASLLDMIVCGGIWVADRGGPRRACACGEPAADAFHRYYQCPLLADIKDEDVVKSAWLSKVLGSAEYRGLECLWGRAIVPAALWDRALAAPEMEEAMPVASAGFAELADRAGQVFTDGSGLWPRKPWSKAGSGMAVVLMEQQSGKPRVKDIAVAAAKVPGRQTVPRAEAWACAKGVQLRALGSHCLIRPDATYVIKECHGG